MTKAQALIALNLDWRRLDALIRLCDPARHAGSLLAEKAHEYLRQLRAEWSACDHPSGWLDKHPPYEPTAPAKPIDLPDDPISDLWAAG